jgi:hypothetical protein
MTTNVLHGDQDHGELDQQQANEEEPIEILVREKRPVEERSYSADVLSKAIAKILLEDKYRGFQFVDNYTGRNPQYAVQRSEPIVHDVAQVKSSSRMNISTRDMEEGFDLGKEYLIVWVISKTTLLLEIVPEFIFKNLENKNHIKLQNAVIDVTGDVEQRKMTDMELISNQQSLTIAQPSSSEINLINDVIINADNNDNKNVLEDPNAITAPLISKLYNIPEEVGLSEAQLSAELSVLYDPKQTKYITGLDYTIGGIKRTFYSFHYKSSINTEFPHSLCRKREYIDGSETTKVYRFELLGVICVEFYVSSDVGLVHY